MANTLFIGKVYLRFDELASTNDYTLDLLAATTNSRPPEGTVVRAANQSAGRGQYGSRWESTPGENLLLSVVLYPVWLEAGAQFYLSMATALALRDTAAASCPASAEATFAVKWPNDLYSGDRKCAGILIQNALLGNHLQSSVVGIGLNVNQTDFHPDIPNPTSLALATGQKLDLEQVANTLFEYLEHRYLQLKSGQRATLKAEYEQHLHRSGIWAPYTHPDGTRFEGMIRGVTDEGRLRMGMSDGSEQRFGLKEVTMV